MLHVTSSWERHYGMLLGRIATVGGGKKKEEDITFDLKNKGPDLLLPYEILKYQSSD